MKTALRILCLAALAGLGVWLWTSLFPSPQKVIRKRLTELARTASFSAHEGNLARLAAGRKLASFFSTNVEVHLQLLGRGPRTFVGRAAITQAALAAQAENGSLRVTFPDIHITVAPNSQSALVDLTVLANISSQSEPIAQEMKFTFQKSAGAWLITRVQTVRTLSK